jgi:heme O synthase-like polyprenyltransferase
MQRQLIQCFSGLPGAPLFLALISYGGWLLAVLTWLFWHWSGMASLGLAYLIFVAPILMIGVAWKLYDQRNQSPLHFKLFIVCLCYPILPLTALAIELF